MRHSEGAGSAGPPHLPRVKLSHLHLRQWLFWCAVQAHDSVAAQDTVAAWQEERRVSKYASTLEQLPATRPIPMDPSQVRQSRRRHVSVTQA